MDIQLRDRRLIEAVCEFANREIGSDDETEDDETEVVCAFALFTRATSVFRSLVPQDPGDYTSRPVQEPFELYDELDLVSEARNDGPPYISPQQVIELQRLLKETDVRKDLFLKWARAGSLNQIPANRYRQCAALLTREDARGDQYRGLLNKRTVERLKKDQQQVIAWLDRLHEYGEELREHRKQHGKNARLPVPLKNAVSRRLGKVRVAGTVSFGKGGLQPKLDYNLNDLESAIGYAFALILDERNGLHNRVGKCRKDGCGKYWVDFKKIGQPQTKYCCDKHRNQQKSKDKRDRDRLQSIPGA